MLLSKIHKFICLCTFYMQMFSPRVLLGKVSVYFAITIMDFRFQSWSIKNILHQPNDNNENYLKFVGWFISFLIKVLFCKPFLKFNFPFWKISLSSCSSTIFASKAKAYHSGAPRDLNGKYLTRAVVPIFEKHSSKFVKWVHCRIPLLALPHKHYTRL
jgi:hypothetical protein